MSAPESAKASDSKGVAIVTGAARGIGYALSLRLAQDGYDVAVNDIETSKSSLEDLAEEINKTGRKGLVVIADVTKEDDVQAMVEKTVAELGGLDVMIANAGVLFVQPIHETVVEDWDRIHSVNVKGTMLCFKHAAREMIKQGRGGNMLAACSSAGKKGLPHLAAYVASKFAIRGLVQASASDLGKYKIRVNAYTPGPIETPMLMQHRDARGDAEAWRNEVKAMNVLGEIGTVEDAAELVSFLVSPRARLVTGQCYNVDGGLMFD